MRQHVRSPELIRLLDVHCACCWDVKQPRAWIKVCGLHGAKSWLKLEWPFASCNLSVCGRLSDHHGGYKGVRCGAEREREREREGEGEGEGEGGEGGGRQRQTDGRSDRHRQKTEKSRLVYRQTDRQTDRQRAILIWHIHFRNVPSWIDYR